jgi:hypothetical protein
MAEEDTVLEEAMDNLKEAGQHIRAISLDCFASNGYTLANAPQYDGSLFLASFDGEDSATRGLHVSLAFFAASIQGWTTLGLSSSQVLTPASGSPASLMSASIWLTSSLLSEIDLMNS